MCRKIYFIVRRTNPAMPWIGTPAMKISYGKRDYVAATDIFG
jgi:hypothetical protein